MTSPDNYRLDPNTRYTPFIAKGFANSIPIVKAFSGFNPIFICAADRTDRPDNFIYAPQEGDSSSEKARSMIENEQVSRLFERLHNQQYEVWVKIFRNGYGFEELFTRPGIRSMGLSPEESEYLNNKNEQYELIRGKVPLADHIITRRIDAPAAYDALSAKDGIISILPYGGGGSGSRVHKTRKSLEDYLSTIQEDKLILASALPVDNSPSIDLIVANKDEIMVYQLVDQVMHGLQCLGGRYPSELPDSTRNECNEIARTVGETVANLGMRGHIGVDFIISEGQPYFCEINARYMGTTGCRMLSMEEARPSKSPTIPELELMAVRDGTFHGHRLWDEPLDYYWYKKELEAPYEGNIQPVAINSDPSEAYRKRAGTVLVGQMQPGTHVKAGETGIGNYISVQRTPQALDASIEYADIILAEYVKPTNQSQH